MVLFLISVNLLILLRRDFVEETNVNTYASPKVTERNSSFELLRIIAIFFIIASHFSVHGGYDFSLLQGRSTRHHPESTIRPGYNIPVAFTGGCE